MSEESRIAAWREWDRYRADPTIAAMRDARQVPAPILQAMRDEVEQRRPMAPHAWDRVQRTLDGEGWISNARKLRMIWSVALEDDSHPWIHASVSRRDRLPTYDEMMTIRRWVFGPDRWAYQVHPPDSGPHVNLREVLHLWGRLDGTPQLPEFSAVTSTGERTI